MRNLENPRKEAAEHHCNPDNHHLLYFRYQPTHDMKRELRDVLKFPIKYQDRIESKKHVIMPDNRWDGQRKKSKYLLFLSGVNLS